MTNNLKKIFLIEDEQSIITPLEILFKKEGFAVEVAKDGETAVEMLNTTKADVIILDLLLPKMHGFEVLKKIKSNQSTKNIPVVIVSNLGSEQNIQEGLKLGAIKYFVKPKYAIFQIIEYVKEILTTKNN